MHAESLQKNAYGLVYARLFNCAADSLPWRLLRTYFESCANIVQAVAYCPEAPDRIQRHSRNGPRTHECCFEVVLFLFLVL